LAARDRTALLTRHVRRRRGRGGVVPLQHQHWLSDVVLGAGIGTFAGNKIVRYNHRSNPNNRLNRWLLSASIVPSGVTGHRLKWSLLPLPRWTGAASSLPW
jgi:hypothetical protein